MGAQRVTKRSLLFCLTAFTIWNFSACSPHASADTSAEKNALTPIEQRLFFKTYQEEDVSKRLSRIERRVFGEELQGGFDERLERVKTAMGPQVNPDGSVTGAPKPQQQHPAPTQKPPPPSRTKQEDDDYAIEDAKRRVQAAKDEEITRLLKEGVDLWHARRAQEAVEKFEQVVRLDPNNAEAHYSLGIVYEASKNYVEALASYKKAAEARPDSKEYRDAVKATEKLAAQKAKVEDLKGDVRALAEQAAQAFKEQQYISALDLYKQVDEKAPNQPLIKYNIGTIYLMMKNPFSALEYYKQARKLKPDEPRYVEACKKLEVNLKKDQDEREKIDAAWAQKEKQTQSGQSGKKRGSDSSSSSPNDLMTQLGIIAKTAREGLVVTTVGIASRAARGGLRTGDIIKAIDGTVVKSPGDANDLLSRKNFNQPVQIMIQRAQQMGALTI